MSSPTPTIERSANNLKTDFGVLRFGASESGLTFVAFGDEKPLGVHSESSVASDHVAQAISEIDEYLRGQRQHFDVALDLSSVSGFRRSVLEHMIKVDYATTVSYSELAERAGSARAVRAVGTACATNPIPFVIPCHRVLRSDGSLGGYRGGLEFKRHLLDLESRS